MGLAKLTKKPKKERINFSYRPPDEHIPFVRGMLKGSAGEKLGVSDAMRMIVGIYRQIDAELGQLRPELEAFARQEGIEAIGADDQWLGQAIARAAKISLKKAPKR